MSKKKDYEKENRERRTGYGLMIEQMVGSMFEEKCPWRQEFLEKQLLRWGWGAIGKSPKNGKLYVGYCSNYEKDEYNLPTGPCWFHTLAGYEFQGVIGETVIIGYNNDWELPELMIDQFGDLFNETDISITSCLKKSKVNPIPVAANDKVKKALGDIMEDVDNGNTKIVAYEGAFEQIAEGVDPITVINVTDPKQTDKLQYLSKFHDDILRRVCTLYGHALSSGSKMAQVTSMELEGYTTFARIYPQIMMKARKAWFDEVNEKLQPEEPLTITWSEAFKHLEHEIVLQEEEKGGEDNEDNSGVPEKPEDK